MLGKRPYRPTTTAPLPNVQWLLYTRHITQPALHFQYVDNEAGIRLYVLSGDLNPRLTTRQRPCPLSRPLLRKEVPNASLRVFGAPRSGGQVELD